MSLAWGLGAHYTISDASQFAAELEDVLDTAGSEAGLEGLDLAINAYISFAAQFYDPYLLLESDIDRCIARLLASRLLHDHPDRCINTIIELLVTSQDPATQHLCLCTLLKRGDTHPHVFRWLRRSRSQVQESPTVLSICMSLVEQFGVQSVGTAVDGDENPHPAEERLGVDATKVLFEICRVTRFDLKELALFATPFISHLFRLVESTRDGDEAFNFSIVKLIISLNEQFMVASVEEDGSPPSVPLSPTKHKKKPSKQLVQKNRVLQVLSEQLGALKTFGENLVFIINRLGSTPEDLCVALLILKMLYLLFSTPATHEYFYTNDLCVLVDVFLRVLSDLPEESEGLRHTYLRVLYPLLTNTQLREHPYKRHQIRRVLRSLVADNHIHEVNVTTKRLAERNLRAEWCTELERNGVTLEEATKQISPAALDAAQTSLNGALPSIPRKGSTASVGSGVSAGSVVHTAHASVFGGLLHAEPMTASITSITEVGKTGLGRLRKHVSSSSSIDLPASPFTRPDSPPVHLRVHEDAPGSPGHGHGIELIPGEAFSPPSRPSSAMSTGSSSGRRQPPPPPQHASRHVKMTAAVASRAGKQRRAPPDPPRLDKPSGLNIESLAVS